MNRIRFFFLAAACCVTAIASNGCAAQAPQVGGLTQGGVGDMRVVLPTNAHPGLRDPSQAKFTSPEKFMAKFETTKGDFVIEVNREWAPNGADRFYSMIKVGFFEKIAIFRAIDNFMFQFGIHGVPEVAAAWQKATIKDDAPAGKSNTPGTISFAQTGRPNSRSSQMFINLGNNGPSLDRGRNGGAGFYPFGHVVKGKEVISKINVEYGENRGNVQGDFVKNGNAYIQNKYPNIDFIKRVTILNDPAAAGSGTTPAAGSGTQTPAGSGTTPAAGSGTQAPAGSGTTPAAGSGAQTPAGSGTQGSGSQ